MLFGLRYDAGFSFTLSAAFATSAYHMSSISGLLFAAVGRLDFIVADLRGC